MPSNHTYYFLQNHHKTNIDYAHFDCPSFLFLNKVARLLFIF